MSNQTETTNSGSDASHGQLDGGMIMLTQAASTVYIAPIGEPGGEVNLVVRGTPPPGAISTFVVTIQETDGETTKVSLQPLGMDGYWVTGQNIAGLAYPIIVGPNPETFLLTGSLLGGQITIATAFSPPGSAIWGYNPQTGASVLTYGHESPLIQGLFDLLVVG